MYTEYIVTISIHTCKQNAFTFTGYNVHVFKNIIYFERGK